MSTFEEISGFIDHLGDAIFITNESSQIVFANLACLELFGYSEQKMSEMSIKQLMSIQIPNHSVMVNKFIKSNSKARPMMTRRAMLCINSSGETFNARISIASVTIDGQLFGVATIQDFSLLQAELEQLKIDSNQDALTELYNRRYLQKIILPEGRLMRTWQHIGVIYMDLNKFKPLNDLYGHDIGDTVLSVIAKRLKSSIRFDDLAFRVGGDEFLVLLNISMEKNKNKTMLQVIEKIRKEVVKSIKIEHLDVSVGLSAGYGIYPDHGDDFEDIIKQADQAMYLAKKSGTGVACVK